MSVSPELLGLISSNDKTKLDESYLMIDIDSFEFDYNIYNNIPIDITSAISKYWIYANYQVSTNICIRYKNTLFYLCKDYMLTSPIYALYNDGNWIGILKMTLLDKIIISVHKIISYTKTLTASSINGNGKWIRIAKLTDSTLAEATITIKNSWNTLQPGYVKFHVGCGRFGARKDWTIRKIYEDTGFIRKIRTNYNTATSDNTCYIEIFVRPTSMTILSTAAEISAYSPISLSLLITMEDCTNAVFDNTAVTELGELREICTHGIMEYGQFQALGGIVYVPVDAKFIYINSMTDDEYIDLQLVGSPLDMLHPISIYLKDGHGGSELRFLKHPIQYDNTGYIAGVNMACDKYQNNADGKIYIYLLLKLTNGLVRLVKIGEA